MSRPCCLIATVLFALSIVVKASAEDDKTVIQKRAAPVTEAFEAPTPVEPVDALPVLAVDREGKPVPAKRKVWDVFKLLPIAFYTPETSLGFGAGALFLFNMPGAVQKRRPSSVSLAGIYTLEHQLVAQVVPELRFGDDDYVLRLEILGNAFPSRFYGIGNDVSNGVYDSFKDRQLRTGFEARMRPFRAGSKLRDVFIGAEYKSVWSSPTNEKPRKETQESVFAKVENPGEREQFSSGIGPLLAWDSRDGLNWPLKGSYVEAKGLFNEPWLQSTLRYRALSLDARRYQPLYGAHILALRFVHRSSWGETPFQQLPQLGGANLFRGYYAGQLRDKHLTALEAEYRWPLSPRWAATAFGSVGQVAGRPSDYALRHLRAAGGAGLRFAVDVETRTNIRLDAAYGDGFQLYIHFREAF